MTATSRYDDNDDPINGWDTETFEPDTDDLIAVVRELTPARMSEMGVLLVNAISDAQAAGTPHENLLIMIKVLALELGAQHASGH